MNIKNLINATQTDLTITLYVGDNSQQGWHVVETQCTYLRHGKSCSMEYGSSRGNQLIGIQLEGILDGIHISKKQMLTTANHSLDAILNFSNYIEIQSFDSIALTGEEQYSKVE